MVSGSTSCAAPPASATIPTLAGHGLLCAADCSCRDTSELDELKAKVADLELAFRPGSAETPHPPTAPPRIDPVDPEITLDEPESRVPPVEVPRHPVESAPPRTPIVSRLTGRTVHVAVTPPTMPYGLFTGGMHAPPAFSDTTAPTAHIGAVPVGGSMPVMPGLFPGMAVHPAFYQRFDGDVMPTFGGEPFEFFDYSLDWPGWFRRSGIPELHKAEQLVCSLRGDLQKNVRRKQNEHMLLTFEEIWAYLKDEYGKFPDKLVHQKWLHYPPPSEWTLSTLHLFWDGYVERREAWRTLCGNVSHTEDRDCLKDKLPEWLKVEVVDEESNKGCKECWISIAGLPPRLETHRIAAFVSQVISRAEVSSSFEDLASTTYALGRNGNDLRCSTPLRVNAGP